MTLLILRVLLKWRLEQGATAAEQAAEATVTVEGRCEIYYCGFRRETERAFYEETVRFLCAAESL